MELYYIRHAQSTNNAAFAKSGTDEYRVEDPGLSELGLAQAEKLAQFIRNNGLAPGFQANQGDGKSGELTHIYTSLMVRAVQTGAAVSRATGIKMETLIDAHECGGIFLADPTSGERCGLPGKPRSFYLREYPDLTLPESLDESGWWNKDFEMEEDRLPRARRLLAALIEKHGASNDRVAVVSHGGFYNEFITALMDLPKRNGVWFTLNNASISRVDFHDEEIEVMYHNRMDFLPRAMIT